MEAFLDGREDETEGHTFAGQGGSQEGGDSIFLENLKEVEGDLRGILVADGRGNDYVLATDNLDAKHPGLVKRDSVTLSAAQKEKIKAGLRLLDETEKIEKSFFEQQVLCV